MVSWDPPRKLIATACEGAGQGENVYSLDDLGGRDD